MSVRSSSGVRRFTFFICALKATFYPLAGAAIAAGDHDAMVRSYLVLGAVYLLDAIAEALKAPGMPD